MTVMPQARALLVEDEGIIRMMMSDFLQDEGFDVVEARDGDTAVKLLDSPDKFHLLLTDVRMPGNRDGIDVAVHARQLYPQIPILIMSGYALAFTKRISVFDPAVLFIRKPYQMEAIRTALREMSSMF